MKTKPKWTEEQFKEELKTKGRGKKGQKETRKLILVPVWEEVLHSDPSSHCGDWYSGLESQREFRKGVLV